MGYLVIKEIPFEGDFRTDFDTLEEVIEYINDGKSYSDLDDYLIIENPQYIDIYNLMKE